MSRSAIESLETRSMMSATAPIVADHPGGANADQQGIIAILIGLRQQKASAGGFAGGVFVAAGDVNGDGRADGFATAVDRARVGGLIDDPFFFDLGAE
jgi:hypothetical protein